MAKSNKVGFLIAGLALLGAAIFAFKPKETTGGGSTPPPGGGSTPPPRGGSTPPPGSGSKPSTIDPTFILAGERKYVPGDSHNSGTYDYMVTIFANVKNNSSEDLALGNLNAKLDFVFADPSLTRLRSYPVIIEGEFDTIFAKKQEQVLMPINIKNEELQAYIENYFYYKLPFTVTIKGTVFIGETKLNFNKVIPISKKLNG